MTAAAQFRRKLVRADLERMNLPEDYWFVRVDGVSGSVRAAVARFLWKVDEMIARGVGLFVIGPKGVGKTAVAALVAKEARSRGYTVFFARIWELREMIRSRIAFDDETSIMGRAREVDVLVLDDLRTEDANEKFFSASDLEQLIEYRSSKKRVTVVTTRLVKELQGGSIGSLYESAKRSMVPFPIQGPDLHEERQQHLKRAVFGD
jgi:DNA replication protein DnaC